MVVNTAYNVSKAGVRALTEWLVHSLCERTGDRVTTHLLLPGFVWTGMTARGQAEKPDGAWTSDQVTSLLIEQLEAGDLIENQPALSRCRPDWKDDFTAHMAAS